jgi:hypothetical protein
LYNNGAFHHTVRLDNQPQLDFGGQRNPDGQSLQLLRMCVKACTWYDAFRPRQQMASV